MSQIYLPKKEETRYKNVFHIKAEQHSQNWASVLKDIANESVVYVHEGNYSDAFSAQILDKKHITIIILEPQKTTFSGNTAQARYLFDIVNSSFIHLYGIKATRSGLFRLAGQNRLSGHPNGEVSHHIYAEGCEIKDCETNSVVYTGPNNHHVTVNLCHFNGQKLTGPKNQEWGWYMLGFSLALLNSRIKNMVKGNFVIRGHRPLNHLDDWNTPEKFNTTLPSVDVVMDKKNEDLAFWDKSYASHTIEGCVFDGVQQNDYHAIGEFFIGYAKNSSENHYLPPQNTLIKGCYFSGEQPHKKDASGGDADNMPYGAIKLEESYGFAKGADGSDWRTHIGLDAKGVVIGAKFEENFSEGKLLRIVGWLDWMDSREEFKTHFQALHIPYVMTSNNHEYQQDIHTKIAQRLDILKKMGCPLD